MPVRRALRPFAALLATAVLGGAVAVGVVALLGDLGGDTTIVTQTVAASTSDPAFVGAPMSINEIYRRSAPGVVQVTSTTRSSAPNPFGDRFSSPPVQALGSGFVIDKAGHIVTNYHVVEGADDIKVSFSNQDTVTAKVVGTDPSTDLAVLRVNETASALTPLTLGDSDHMEVGDEVVAIGNPFGLDRTATAGIVSALQRGITAPNGYTIDHAIQTDAPINHGNSGGPLLNTRGQVVGVNSQIETGGSSLSGNVGIGFAIPSNTVKNVVAQILRTGSVAHAYLGIVGQDITPTLADNYKLPANAGVLVATVRHGSGASKAGIRAGKTHVVVAGETYVLGGDIIVAADGKPISSIDELRDAIAAHKPGDRIKLVVLRGAKRTSVRVTLGRQPASPQG
ncbi:MAG TPA: trypsin-like peptidase domain-containing protein [Gaiellaceae bacterium]|nr:trypsin-like peptidase domain-containing protein [Gaiellaceae bacterium]